jgi:hypothetical protein
VIKYIHLTASCVLIAAMACSVVAASRDSQGSCQSCQDGSGKSSSARRNKHANRRAHYMQQQWQRSQQYNWHSNYAHSAYGQPIALVVPPTAQMQTNWSWGARSARFSRIVHQFGRDYPGQGNSGGRSGFRRTPAWPSDTNQFGVNYVRGPWYPIQP